jgi:mRNA interferase MazF
MTRGDVWWVEFGVPLGSEPGYRRPVIVIQADYLNASHFQTILVVPLTTNLLTANAPGNVLVPKVQTGLSKDSVAIVAQVYPADRTRFIEQVGQVSDKVLGRLVEGIQLAIEG